MARFELSECHHAVLGEGPVNASTLFELGMMYSVGRSVPVDYVTAHKWFNLSAMQGNSDAARLRQEVAEQMSSLEIATAQRAARAWLKAA
jgi:TPR repeat protein